MPLTPADVHNVAFSKPPIGKRGYNEDEVDAFLDLVEQELGKLIEENTELTIRSVVDNLMLYQEGWGVGRIKHSLTYSGGLSRSYLRTYAPARHYGFEGFSPYTRPSVIEIAEGIPFTTITGMSVEKLYALKGEIVSRGVRAVTGLEMPLFPKRRFQHGAVPVERLRERVSGQESEYRKQFLALYN